MTGTIRRASAADLAQIYDIWYEAEVEDDPNPPPPITYTRPPFL